MAPTHHAWLLLAATALLPCCSGNQGRSSQLRVKSPENKWFCLRVDAYAKGSQDPARAARQAGAVVDVFDCDFADTEQIYLNHDIVDHWVLGAKSTGHVANVRHWLSGLCLSADPELGTSLETCRSETAWLLNNGHLQVGTRPNEALCLEPTWNATNYGEGKKFPLKLLSHCSSQWQVTPNPLVVYPVPDPSWLPNYPYIYNVTVCIPSGGRCYESYAYYTEPMANAASGSQGGKNVSFTTVSFDGDALKGGISITVQSKSAFTTCIIAPRHLGIACNKIGNNRVEFVIPKPMMKVSVEFDPPAPNDASRALNVVPAAMLIFADPLDDIPDPGDPRIVYLGPGVHDISTHSFPKTSTDDGCMTVPANTEVYVAGGAYVVGAFRTLPGVNNVTIRGRGVVTIEGAKVKKGCVDGLVTLCAGLDLRVEGVAVVDSQEGCVSHIGANCYFQTRNNLPCNINPPAGRGPVITNVKVIGWQFATGIMPGRGAHVSDSFIRTNDDCNPDFQSNQVWERNTLWQLDNGWPFMIQWNTNDVFEPALAGGAQNVVYQDSTVVHVEQVDARAYGGDRRSVFGAWQGMSNTKTNIKFKNIAIEGGMWTALIMLYIGNGPFSEVPYKCCGNGNLTDISFENIQFEYHGAQTSLLLGDSQAGGGIHNINFNDVTIYSQDVTNASFIPMRVDAATTSGISFQAGSTRPVELRSELLI